MKTSPVILCAAALFHAGGLCAQEAVASKYKTVFYGHIKMDAVYDVHGAAADDYMMYVASRADSARDLRVSARATRFGFDISDGAGITAKIESDFLGLTDSVGGTAGSVAGVRLRHAYVALKAGDWEILAGQTWHLTPLEFAGTNNEFVFGYTGTLYYRVPQLRVTWKPGARWTLAAAAARPTRKLTDSEGTASGTPLAEAQAQTKLGAAKLTLAGAFGKWRNPSGQYGEVILADLGFNVPLGVFTLNGQAWTGKNLYDFLGGIGNMGYAGREVKASGGFVNLQIKPAGKFSFNAAAGVDNPEDPEIAAGAAARVRNSTLMANVNLLVREKITVTFETDHQVTRYKLPGGKTDYFNNHYQLSFKFPF